MFLCIAYFLPHEGTNDIAWGIIGFATLAACEAYRQRLKTDPEGLENFRHAQQLRFILREERNFVEVVDGTLNLPSTLQETKGTAMPSQAEKGRLFRALHQRDRAFLIPNPWDIGTAKILTHLGFEALATTSAGYAFSQGLPDGRVGRDAMLSHAASIASATGLPVSADLENGYGHSPEEVAETIRLAAAAGLAGCSIEDATGDPSNPIYTPSHARDRIQAAVSAVRSLPFPFTLTARAENYLHGRPDLHDTILRLQAYQEAGADVLYAPGLVTSGDISAVVSSVARPVNVLAGLKGMQLTLAELSDLGVKRVSVGSGLSNAAMGAFLRASGDMLQNGAFNFGEDTAILAEIKAVFAADSQPSA